jgi:hypothetical protein
MQGLRKDYVEIGGQLWSRPMHYPKNLPDKQTEANVLGQSAHCSVISGYSKFSPFS